MTPTLLKKIAFLLGDWNVTMEVKPDPEGEWVKSAATSRFETVLGDAAIRQTFEGSMMGQRFLGLGYFCFSRMTGKWQHSWIDNLAALISYYEGDFIEDKLVLTGVEKGPETSSFQVRLTWHSIGESAFGWLLETSPDEQSWWPVMKMDYTRAIPVA
ncbi:MAG: DUF1579 family protein [candidate division Zixibacteria bacterium]|nr:DUF1579 family protein [candidate division Zixibacteria bacterium]